jgi:hypothetical protein
MHSHMRAKRHAPVLIDSVKSALRIQCTRKKGRAALRLPLLAESEQVRPYLVHTLYVGGRVALYAFVLVPQHMQQRL